MAGVSRFGRCVFRALASCLGAGCTLRAAGLIAAHVAMGLLGFERHGMMSHIGHHRTTALAHMLFEVSVDIALVVDFVMMLKRIVPHTYEGGIIATYDVERVLNWRLFAALMALPFYVFAVRFVEAALAGALFGMSFDVWPVLGADLVGYFVFLPTIVGIIWRQLKGFVRRSHQIKIAGHMLNYTNSK